MSKVIHKVNITAEAKFDVLEELNLEGFNWKTLKDETEQYIKHQSIANRIPWWGYFRADYEDEDNDVLLKLFFYRGEKVGVMQFWNLVGVCVANAWTDDLEEDGEIRSWLKTRIQEIPDEDDWVIRLRVNEILNNTEKTLWTNVFEEVMDAFEYKRDKEVAKKVAFLQSAYFDFYK